MILILLFFIHILNHVPFASIGEDSFICKNRQRIPKLKECDKIVDCDDGSDEINCGQSI